MPNKKFIRQETSRYSKIGKNRKKLQRWRKPKGRDSKMRLKRKSYPATVSVGYSRARKEQGKVNGKLPILVHHVKDLEKITKDNVALLARVGAKKKLEIIKKAEEKKIQILNVKGDKK
ncbi:MAG: eL32 family ribosomal protein [Nanoarchaeota archaeon]|nr:eL32 family ribosomal protein [Nanoarchaeota archaeon]MBU0977795.1 eL32 family ribosomal protein [Nanoarchaeota archaeon]